LASTGGTGYALTEMSTEGPTPLNYATPVKRVYWRWPWGMRLGVAVMMAVIHFGSGCLFWVYGIQINFFVAFVLFPRVLLVSGLDERYRMHLSWVGFTVCESLCMGALLAALFERIDRYLHERKDEREEINRNIPCKP
jgi:hypothetical protein